MAVLVMSLISCELEKLKELVPRKAAVPLENLWQKYLATFKTSKRKNQ